MAQASLQQLLQMHLLKEVAIYHYISSPVPPATTRIQTHRGKFLRSVLEWSTCVGVGYVCKRFWGQPRASLEVSPSAVGVSPSLLCNRTRMQRPGVRIMYAASMKDLGFQLSWPRFPTVPTWNNILSPPKKATTTKRPLGHRKTSPAHKVPYHAYVKSRLIHCRLRTDRLPLKIWVTLTIKAFEGQMWWCHWTGVTPYIGPTVSY